MAMFFSAFLPTADPADSPTCLGRTLQESGTHEMVCRVAGRDVVTRAGGSAASSATVHSPSADKMRSRTRHSGSRTLHLAYCSQVPSSVEQAVTVTGPSI